jgi:hypothetical protein
VDFSKFIQFLYLGIRGFSPQNIWRMKQFFETYNDNEKLSTLSREISWSNNVLIMMGAKSDEAREFYLLLAQKNNYSARKFERQMDSMLFERTAPCPKLFACWCCRSKPRVAGAIARL